MVQASRLVPLVSALLLVVALAGCLSDFVTDPTCPPTVVAASWTQDGAWDAFPSPGLHGPYNVSLLEATGIEFNDTEWGSIVLSSVEWLPEDNMSMGLYRFEHTGRLTITLPEDHDARTLEDGFLEFVSYMSEMDEQEARDRSDQLLNERLSVKAQTTQQGTDTNNDADMEESDALENVAFVEYKLELQGPYRFETLYEQLLADAGLETHPDPWQDDTVEIGAWTFTFPVPIQRADHTQEAGRLLKVDARDRLGFQWDPPAGAGQEAIMAGISRTLSDLEMPAPPAASEIELFTASC